MLGSKICPCCGESFEGKNKTCSPSCARSYSTKFDNKKEKKEVSCISCGKAFMINKRADAKKARCQECKEAHNAARYNSCKICGEVNCDKPFACKHFRLIPSFIKYFGFNEETIGTKDVHKEFARVFSILKEDYIDNKLSTVEMAKKYSYPDAGNLNNFLDTFKIEKRSRSSAISLSVKKGILILPGGKSNQKWHTTWDDKKVFLRSSYEENYARVLDSKKIPYFVENLRIQYWDSQLNKLRIAIPDFYIPKENKIVEIKSEYYLDKVNMKDKKEAYLSHGFLFSLVVEGVERDV